MDKVLEVVVVATIVIVIGAIMAYLVNDEASSFSDFVTDQRTDSQCEIWSSQTPEAPQEACTECPNLEGDDCEDVDGSSSADGPSSGNDPGNAGSGDVAVVR